jgi:hypothetical protein
MQEQIDPERVQLGQEAHEVLQAAAEPITRPGHDHIELALVASCHRSQNCYRNRGVADVVVFDSVEVALEERPMGTDGANKGLSQMINLGYRRSEVRGRFIDRVYCKNPFFADVGLLK